MWSDLLQPKCDNTGNWSDHMTSWSLKNKRFGITCDVIISTKFVVRSCRGFAHWGRIPAVRFSKCQTSMSQSRVPPHASPKCRLEGPSQSTPVCSRTHTRLGHSGNIAKRAGGLREGSSSESRGNNLGRFCKQKGSTKVPSFHFSVPWFLSVPLFRFLVPSFRFLSGSGKRGIFSEKSNSLEILGV